MALGCVALAYRVCFLWIYTRTMDEYTMCWCHEDVCVGDDDHHHHRQVSAVRSLISPISLSKSSRVL